MTAEQIYRVTVPDELAGERLDKALASIWPAFSRSRLQGWMRNGALLVDGERPAQRTAVRGGELVELTLTPEPEVSLAPQAISLDVVYEDEDLLVINKPVGLVVHPGAGNPSGTLQNALLHYAPEVESVPRAGLIHRLDKDTSGLLVVARSERAHTALTAAMQARKIEREYCAIVCGVLTAGGRVDAPVGRHPRDRKRMTVRSSARPAVTHYRVIERFRRHTYVRLKLETGRTHQIRVHMQHLNHPLVGDPVYGGRLQLPPGAGESLREALRHFRRQALHARRLALLHPVSGESLSWKAPLPADMQTLLAVLREDAQTHDG